MGRIDHLNIKNFKSYEGPEKIGPFKTFTAVIGPNGKIKQKKQNNFISTTYIMLL